MSKNLVKSIHVKFNPPSNNLIIYLHNYYVQKFEILGKILSIEIYHHELWINWFFFFLFKSWFWNRTFSIFGADKTEEQNLVLPPDLLWPSRHTYSLRVIKRAPLWRFGSIPVGRLKHFIALYFDTREIVKRASVFFVRVLFWYHQCAAN